jgi:hypothetical protein
MKPLLFACCLVFLTLCSTQTANADLAPSRPSDDKISRPAPEKGAKYVLHTSLEIGTDPKAYEAKLQISESDFKTLRASLDGNAGVASIVGGISFSSTRTIMAGLLMFLAVSVAGVLIARSAAFGRTQKVLAALFLIAVLIGATAIMTRGNAGPPGSYRWRGLPQALAEGKSTIGGLDIEVVPDSQMSGKPMRLIIPLKKQNGNGEE